MAYMAGGVERFAPPRTFRAASHTNRYLGLARIDAAKYAVGGGIKSYCVSCAQLLVEWTYYKEGECENTYSPEFYGPCYRDEGSFENIHDEVLEARMNPLIVVSVKEGMWYLVWCVALSLGRCFLDGSSARAHVSSPARVLRLSSASSCGNMLDVRALPGKERAS